jgi:hypothetical protein
VDDLCSKGRNLIIYYPSQEPQNERESKQQSVTTGQLQDKERGRSEDLQMITEWENVKEKGIEKEALQNNKQKRKITHDEEMGALREAVASRTACSTCLSNKMEIVSSVHSINKHKLVTSHYSRLSREQKVPAIMEHLFYLGRCEQHIRCWGKIKHSRKAGSAGEGKEMLAILCEGG